MAQYIPHSNNSFQDFKSAPLFYDIKAGLQRGEKPRLNGVIEFNIIQGPEGRTLTWFIDTKNGGISCDSSDGTTPEATATIRDEHLKVIMDRRDTFKKAFLTGRLQVKGKIPLALTIQSITNVGRQTKAKL